MIKRLRGFAEISGLVAGVLILLAIIRVYVHYQYYSINIIPYLDFSEVLLTVFSDLKVIWRLLLMLTGNLLLVPLIWGFLVPLTARTLLYFRSRKMDTIESQVKHEIIGKMTSPKTMRFRLVLGLFGFIMITAGVFRFFGVWSESVDDVTFYVWSIVLSFGLFSITWGIINHFFRSAVIVGLILSFFIFVLLGKHDPTLDAQHARQVQWTIITETDTLKTDEDFFVAGKTNHYYFLYDRPAQTTLILPVSEIRRATVRRIRGETNRLRDLLENGLRK